MIKPAENSQMDHNTLLLGTNAFTELRLGIMPLTYIKDATRKELHKILHTVPWNDSVTFISNIPGGRSS